MKILPIVNPPFGRWTSGSLLYQVDYISMDLGAARTLFNSAWAYFVSSHNLNYLAEYD